MLVQCPRCRTQIRLSGFISHSRVQPYWCTGCREGVRLDLLQDEVLTSSSAHSYRAMQRPAMVLVADKPSDEVAGAVGALRKAGFIVQFCRTVDEAFSWIDRKHPDLVITALRLPGGGGLTLLRRIRGESRLEFTPVMIVSSLSGDPVVDRLIRQQAQGFVPRRVLRETVAFRAKQALAERAPAR